MNNNKQVIKILYKPYYDFPFRQYNLPIKSKKIGGQRLSSVYAYKETDENLDLANKHNKLLEEIEQKQIELKELQNQMKHNI